MRAIGLDLTDSHAATLRDVDVAVVDEAGRCAFGILRPHHPSQLASDWLAGVPGGVQRGDILVIDGPLGLAAQGNNLRECERALRTPGKTPDTLPTPGIKPFAGYVRSSVELAEALSSADWLPIQPGVDMTRATMLEAFPGATWTDLAGTRLPHKATLDGLHAREALLREHGLQFARSPRTHDQLDAALCAWLGWMVHRQPERIVCVGRPAFRTASAMREGVIVTVKPDEAGRTLVPEPTPQTARSPQAGLPLPDGLRADWWYFATPSRAGFWETAELALELGVLCRSAHNTSGALVANVGRVRPGDTLLLAYKLGDRSYRVIGIFRVEQPSNPVPRAPALQRITEPALHERLSARYPMDPRCGSYTGFLLRTVWAPDDPERAPMIERPSGNNALWRAEDR